MLFHIMRVLKEYVMTDIIRIFNAICIENLGFEAGIFPEGGV